jgi:hypothetical protein
VASGPGLVVLGPEMGAMASLVTTLIALLCMWTGMLLGSSLRRRLPGDHLRDDSKDAVKTASGMIATLVALVIGLLVSSAKSSFDQANAGITQMGAKIILLDRLLGRYGPETKPIRGRLRESIAAAVDRIWPTARGPETGLAAVERRTGVDDVQDMIQRLAPQGEPGRSLREHALATAKDVAESRWVIIEQAQVALPTAFVAMLIFWLTVLFTSLGLLAPRNATTYFCLSVCAISMAGAILLILEMSRPFEGTIRVSPAPMLKALSMIGEEGRPAGP